MEQYTGRNIGIFTDSHALLEPTLAVLIDMKQKEINEIYSLGDNIGSGPNPSEVLDLLNEYNVISIAGNSEEYCTLGIEPFTSYFNELKTQSQLWTLSKLNEEQLGLISLYPRSIELFIGGQNVALCHFANDVRFDYSNRSTWIYQSNLKKNRPAHKQFLHTNSDSQKREIEQALMQKGRDNPQMRGMISATNEPLFGGKTVDKFNALIQGHVHWKLYEESDTTRFYSIRAVGMAYETDSINTASYVVLKEKLSGGFDFEEVLVPYDRERMLNSILNSDSPDKTIEKFTR